MCVYLQESRIAELKDEYVCNSQLHTVTATRGCVHLGRLLHLSELSILPCKVEMVILPSWAAGRIKGEHVDSSEQDAWGIVGARFVTGASG